MIFSKPKIVLVGGGGHCKVVIDTLQANKAFQITGIVDENRKPGERVEGIPVIGRDSDLQKIFEEGTRKAFITLGSLGDTKLRRKLSGYLERIGYECPSIVHPSAQIAPSVELSPGVFVAAGVVIQPGAQVGSHAILNTGSVVDHDCSIGSFVHIAPGAVLSGGVTVGDDSHIGTGVSVIEYKKIGKGTLVGGGSTVVEDIPDNCKAFGNPCKVAAREK